MSTDWTGPVKSTNSVTGRAISLLMVMVTGGGKRGGQPHTPMAQVPVMAANAARAANAMEMQCPGTPIRFRRDGTARLRGGAVPGKTEQPLIVF